MFHFRFAHRKTVPRRAHVHSIALVTLLLVVAIAAGCHPPAVETQPPQGEAADDDSALQDSAEKLIEAGKDEWEVALERAVPCIVSLRITVPRSFDTGSARTTSGTAFIVDAERGLMLTNRHLVMPGPVVAEAIFENREEVDVQAIYRDPVHDFGFYEFDPDSVRYMDVCELELAPEGARVGAEIRIVGNNAGEQISILGGTLARLDRQAPNYGTGNYNDFNTFYYQAASGTSGGSSGSPVLDVDGRVIALNAGSSRQAASSFFLPLDRVVRALELIRRGAPVTRGTLQTVFVPKPFDELARLNFSPESEAAVREARPDEKGLLVVDHLVPEGPGDGPLQPGDILLEVEGELATTFVELESALDDAVGGEIQLALERGGERVDVSVPVADLHAITPSSYVEVGRAIVHPLSYQLARGYAVPVEGLFVANTGFMFSAAGVSRDVLLREVDGDPVDTLDALWRVLVDRADGERITVRYSPIDSPTREFVASVPVDRRWYPLKRCERDPTTGAWPCERAGTAPRADADVAEGEPLSLPEADLPRPAARVAPSLVMVDFDIPYRVEGVWTSYFRGSGVVVDAERGLVLCDRDTVPIGLGDAELTFGGLVRVPATVEFIHPIHNFTILRYDPADLDGLEVPEIEFAPRMPGEGDPTWLVGLDSRHQVAVRETRIDRVRKLSLPMPSRRPEFRDMNLDVMTLVDRTASVGGVLADRRGRVQALWASFHMANDEGSVFRALPADVIRLALDEVRRGADDADPEGQWRYRSLGVELDVVSLADATDLGLPRKWVQALADHDPKRLQILQIDRLFDGFPVVGVLRPGDLILAVDGEPITRFFELERASQSESVALDVMREGGEVETIEVETRELPGFGVERMINWGGALMHEPHLEVATQYAVERTGIYVALTWYGGPASRYDLSATRRIIEVNGMPTPDLDAFLEVVKGLEDGASVRLQALDLQDQESMITLELDNRFWPLYEVRRDDDGGWIRIEHDAESTATAGN